MVHWRGGLDGPIFAKFMIQATDKSLDDRRGDFFSHNSNCAAGALANAAPPPAIGAFIAVV